ncbi:hypothetical protein ABZX95_45475 [Streptomyces sp. NPDC004232]|uniref:hypothetical protein n=1 Tax=Streptomyces sp. NPDC004232 TaxID=3154454 RepID=UPI0033BE929D
MEVVRAEPLGALPLVLAVAETSDVGTQSMCDLDADAFKADGQDRPPAGKLVWVELRMTPSP